MIFRQLVRSVFVSFSLLLFITACGAETETSMPSSSVSSDAQIQAQVESAISSTTDLPQQFSVEVNQGVVSITGSLECENCGGNRTPGTSDTIQQSLGAIVRAVTGVEQVIFNL